MRLSGHGAYRTEYHLVWIPKDEYFEILIGYIALESSSAAVDVLGDRLVLVKYFDMRKNKHSRGRFLGPGFSKIWH